MLNTINIFYNLADRTLLKVDNKEICNLTTFTKTFSKETTEIPHTDFRSSLIVFDEGISTADLQNTVLIIKHLVENIGTDGLFDAGGVIQKVATDYTEGEILRHLDHSVNNTLKYDDGEYRSVSISNEVEPSTNIPDLVEIYGAPGDETVMRIFFRDSTLRTQYDNTTYTVIPPFDLATTPNGIDALRLRWSEMRTALTPPTIDPFKSINERFKDLHGDVPLTDSNGISVPIFNGAESFDTYWMVAINGNPTDVEAGCKQAVYDYILENSVTTEDEGDVEDVWVDHVPSLLNLLTFYMKPNWHMQATNQVNGALVVYTPAMKVSEIEMVADDITREFGLWGDQVRNDGGPLATEVIEYVTTSQKGLTMFTLPDVLNSNGRQSFLELFPDYALIAANQAINAYITMKTRNLIVGLNEMITIAEKHIEGNTLDSIYEEEIINGNLHIVRQLDYLIIKMYCANQ